MRDGFKCRYCGIPVTDETANIDHVLFWPEGLTIPSNLVTACHPCNYHKGRAYVIPRHLKGQHYFRLYRKARPKRVRQVRDPWIREGPMAGTL